MKKYTAIALFLVASQLLAQDQVAFEPMQVTANNFEQSIENSTENSQIITSDMLEKHQVGSLAEALSRLANISITQNGGIGQATSVRLRGFDSKRVLVLIDGVRVNDVTGLNGATFEHILVSDIERIEIIKGAQSGVWGADASAGVINIISKEAKKGFHSTFKAAYGSYNTTEAMLGLSYKAEKFDLKVIADTVGSDGFSAAEPNAANTDFGTKGDDADYEKDAYENQTYQATLGFNITKSDRLKVDLKQVHAYVEYDAGAGTDANNVDDPFGWGASDYFVDTRQDFYQASYTHKDRINDINLMASQSNFDRDQFNGYQGTLVEYGIKDKLSYADDSAVQIGLNRQEVTQSKSGGTDLDKAYINQAFYASNLNHLGSFLLSQALRIDSYDTFDNKTTGKIGAKYSYGDAYVSLNIGTGYNVPTLYQLHDTWSGNSDLTPESSTSIDLKASHKGISLGYFYNAIDDLIDYDNTTFAFANIEGRSVIQGLELFYEKAYHPLANVALDYTYLNAKNSDDQTLARRPNHLANLNVASFFNQASSLISTLAYVGTRHDSADDLGAQTGEYLLVHLTANYELDNYKLFVKVDNLFDTFYQVVDGYQTPGLSFKVGASARY